LNILAQGHTFKTGGNAVVSPHAATLCFLCSSARPSFLRSRECPSHFFNFYTRICYRSLSSARRIQSTS